ncbi:uncharacterized protein [Chelonus insularis]|uniref:uncharacterized protein n=1 Tax=Chelonus insularis TaxID=460826 RepID=UPI00158F43C5|nr:uncharacterized protein LOC118066097 [Chelonus insularis]
MDSNSYRVNIVKWLPFVDSKLESWFTNIIVLHNTTKNLAENIALMTEEVSRSNNISNLEFLNDLPNNFEKIIEDYKNIDATRSSLKNIKSIYNYKMQYLMETIKKLLNVTAKLTYNLIQQMVTCDNEQSIFILFKLVKAYNDSLHLDFAKIADPSVNIFSNDCPLMLEPLKNMSIIRILQTLAKNKAEDYCQELIECLLKNYWPHNYENITSSASVDLDINENSSAEIYRALIKNLSPPNTMARSKSGSRKDISAMNVENLETLIQNQLKPVDKFVKIAKDICPQLFLSNNTNLNKNESIKIKKSTLAKVSDYYQQAVWASISEILDHVILWWSSDSIAVHHNHRAHYLRDWLHLFLQSSINVPMNIKPTLQNLCDTLGCHITTTSWDELFRLAYVASFKCSSRPCSSEITNTGQMFSKVFQLLVSLSNECEMSGEWVTGAPLMELPLSEQILVLHRLDHSVHTMRLWATHESKVIAHTWDLQSFFLIVKGDIKICITELSRLRLADHIPYPNIDMISVQVYVCVKMRAKIVSEVNANILLLKESSSKCINTLAKICRVISLANLHMCFPPSSYWRRTSIVSNITTSSYVQVYLDQVLLPVLEVVEDYEISNMVLKLMCEAWLDYIYLHRFKFTELGAYQLLTDFAFVSEWVTKCPIISQNVKEHLLKNEVLRRCEGVGRLLLRHPGEAIAMKKRITKRASDNESPASLGLERMPAEMYVPNQEQWLELRAEGYYKLHCCS